MWLNYACLVARVNDLASQLKAQKQANFNAKQELEDYKQKATKILQSKDKLITSLKDGLSSASGDNNADGASSSPLSSSNDYKVNLIEIEELRGERDFLKEELFAKNSAIDSLKTELQVGPSRHLSYHTARN